MNVLEEEDDGDDDENYATNDSGNSGHDKDETGSVGSQTSRSRSKPRSQPSARMSAKEALAKKVRQSPLM